MSIRSKAKRDARKKKQRSPGRAGAARPIEEHAHLLDEHGNVFAGAGRRGSEWVLVLGGKVATATDSPAMIIAMLKHVAGLREAAGGGVQLNYSTQLRDAATAEAEREGKTLDKLLAMLEAERDERSADAQESDATDVQEQIAADHRPR